MLNELIFEYIQAGKKKDKKKMASISKQLQRLGMDKLTLMIIVKEFLDKGIESLDDLNRL